MSKSPKSNKTENVKREASRAPVLRYRKIIIAALIVLFISAAGFALYPFMPFIEYRLGLIDQENPYASSITPQGAVNDGETTKPFPQDNRIVIPKIGVDAEIVEGDDADVALEKGIWRIPGTAPTPDQSNMVLSAHRFRYLPPSNRTFYLLDKLEPGDIIYIYWEGEEYNYEITGETVVEPTQVEILDPTEDRQLTLFTCAPLFSTSKRLVLIAKPYSPQELAQQ